MSIFMQQFEKLLKHPDFPYEKITIPKQGDDWEIFASEIETFNNSHDDTWIKFEKYRYAKPCISPKYSNSFYI